MTNSQTESLLTITSVGLSLVVLQSPVYHCRSLRLSCQQTRYLVSEISRAAERHVWPRTGIRVRSLTLEENSDNIQFYFLNLNSNTRLARPTSIMLPTTLYLPFLSLASITLATPTRSLPSSLFKRDAPALDDVAWCNVEFEDAAAVETLWNDWGISALMDFSLAGLSPANEDWVTILVSRSVDNAADIGQFHCGSMYEECVDRLPTCETFVLKGMPQYYYILQAMKNVSGPCLPQRSNPC